MIQVVMRNAETFIDGKEPTSLVLSERKDQAFQFHQRTET